LIKTGIVWVITKQAESSRNDDRLKELSFVSSIYSFSTQASSRLFLFSHIR